MSETKRSIEKLLSGIRKFAKETFGNHREKFESLKQGQNPIALLITCSDSRIQPSLITHADPGDIFVARNAGNIVPAHGTGVTGDLATVEYALSVLEIEHVIICGHSQCGAVAGLFAPENLTNMHSVGAWLEHAKPAMTPRYLDQVVATDQVLAVAQANVLLQIDNLKTHPFVKERLEQAKLSLHAWFYEFESGTIYIYDKAMRKFVPATEKEFALAGLD